MEDAERVTLSADLLPTGPARPRDEPRPATDARRSAARAGARPDPRVRSGARRRADDAVAEKERPSLADEGILPQDHLEEVERTRPEPRRGIEYSDGIGCDG